MWFVHKGSIIASNIGNVYMSGMDSSLAVER